MLDLNLKPLMLSRLGLAALRAARRGRFTGGFGRALMADVDVKPGCRKAESQDGIVRSESGVTVTDASNQGSEETQSELCDNFSRPSKKMKAVISQDSVFAMIVEQSDEGTEMTAEQVVSGTEKSKEEPEVAKEGSSEKCEEEPKVAKEDGSSEKFEEEPEVDKIGEKSNDDEKDKPLSKRAQKRLMKLERLAKRKQEMKAREKELKKERKEQRLQKWANLSAEEKQAAVERSKEGRKTRVEESTKRKEKLKKALEVGQNVVIDFQFCDEMTEAEIAHMGQQVMFSYAANAKAEVPARLSLTSLQGSMKQQLEKLSGYEKWMIHREERPYLDVFSDRKQDLVYLTADSDTVLDTLEDSKIYIIGGLVDHNRMKGLTLRKANEQGISTARLPIQENMKLTSSTVLTVNQVVEIVIEFLNSKDWAKALKSIIPQRKVAQSQA